MNWWYTLWVEIIKINLRLLFTAVSRFLVSWRSAVNRGKKLNNVKGYGIEITNNLLDPKHVKGIGVAIWEYMWLIDKMTSISENGVGLVLGGKPIKLEEIAEEIGKNKFTIRVNLERLKKAGYINLKRTPYGQIISVNKAKKRFGRVAGNTNSDAKRVEENTNSRVYETTNSALVKPPTLNQENTNSNKTVAVDTTVDITKETGVASNGSHPKTPVQECHEFFDLSAEGLSEFSQRLAEKFGMEKQSTYAEVKKFKAYWSEKNKSGTKSRWQSEKHFELRRRFSTWFGNIKQKSQITNKYNASTV